MHITDPSALFGSLLLLSGVIFTAVSGRRERDKQRAHEEEKAATDLARQEAKAADDRERQETKEGADREQAEEDKTYLRLQNDYQRVVGACDRCERRLGACQEALDARDAHWDKHRTNFPEVAGLIAVPGALAVLRRYRDLKAGPDAPEAAALLGPPGQD